MEKVDTTTLTEIIDQCFDLSMDERFTDVQQKKFLAEGKRLRGLLLNLLTAQFDKGTQTLIDANNQLDAVNTALSDSVAVLANAADTLNQVATLVGNIDKLLNVATNFI